MGTDERPPEEDGRVDGDEVELENKVTVTTSTSTAGVYESDGCAGDMSICGLRPTVRESRKGWNGRKERKGAEDGGQRPKGNTNR
jgi:hypothetical protein